MVLGNICLQFLFTFLRDTTQTAFCDNAILHACGSTMHLRLDGTKTEILINIQFNIKSVYHGEYLEIRHEKYKNIEKIT